MAELAVLLAVKKIGGALGGDALKQINSMFTNEVVLLTQLPSSMNRIKREFVVMHAFLSNIHTKEGDDALEVWLQEVRKIAHDVENVIDEFVFLLNENRIRGICSLIHKIIRKPRNIVAWQRIASQLKEIESDLQHITHIKERWVKIKDGDANPTGKMQNRPTDPSQVINEDEDGDFEEAKRIELIIQKLHGEEKRFLGRFFGHGDEVKSCLIISIQGAAGVGKSYLASKVYNKERSKFKRDAWISVPLNCQVEDLLRLMIRELSKEMKEMIPVDIDSMPQVQLRKNLRKLVKDKKYLIVLDDLRETQIFNDMKDALVMNENDQGSRIIITTEFADVAKLADRERQIKVEILKPEQAMKLFVKKTFRKEKYKECPEELRDAANQIVEKCGRLPVVIVNVASLLSRRGKTRSEWEKVLQQFDWSLQNDKSLDTVKATLTLGFDDLPRYLKNCFLFCSIFPKNYFFERGNLIRLWVAEGLIEERAASTMEEVAEVYLDELVGRNLFQEDQNQRIQGYQMHPLVQELLMSKSKKENFSVLCENPEAIEFYDEARHLFLDGRGQKTPSSTIDLPQLRSFMVSRTDISVTLLSSLLSNSRYLIVLDLRGITIDILPKEISELFNLRYLNLRYSKVKQLPKSIGKLRNLQTLDILETEITMLPSEIRKLKKLRHLFVGNGWDPFSPRFGIQHCVGARAPEGKWNAWSIQTLRGVAASEDFVKRLARLTELRSLWITNVRRNHCTPLCTSLTKMPFLSTLHVYASDEKEELALEKLKPFPQRLQNLAIEGRLGGHEAESLFDDLGQDLTWLYLGCSQLTYDPLPLLDHLKNLKFLRLTNACDAKQLLFTAGSFPSLKLLILQNMEKLKHVRILEGALRNLEYLVLVRLGGLKDPPEGIEHIQSLKIIYVCEVHPDFHVKSSKIEPLIRVVEMPKLLGALEPARATKRNACYQKAMKKIKEICSKSSE